MLEINPPSRTPPRHVRIALRKEVGFGCPLCGSPHLEYHHFDPPWADARHHNTEGMIALCGRHHDEADSGAFTKEQLQTLKAVSEPYVKSRFNWQRKYTVFSCGSNYAYKCQSMLTVSGIDMIYFEEGPDGFDTLSLNIYDTCLNPMAVMRQNDWFARTDVDEIEAPPKKPQLVIKSRIHRIDLAIEFRDRKRMNAEELAVLQSFDIPADEDALIVKVTGEIPAPCHAKFSDEGMLLNGNIQFTGNRIRDCGRGIVLG